MQVVSATGLEGKPKHKDSIHGFPLACHNESDLNENSWTHNSFADQIELLAEETWEKCCLAVQELHEAKFPLWLNRLLTHSIIPRLKRIGFDESLCWTLFKIAAPSWALLGPMTVKEAWFHPVLIKDIEEIRSGVLMKAKKKSENLSLLTDSSAQNLHFLVNKNMNPENLISMLAYISRPWIILPRTYDHLEEYHSYCLMGYLKYIDKESDPEFARVLIRIIIEFIGNYTLKYIDKTQSRSQMFDVIFYGYTAMFWRNLSRPPNSLEDLRIFDFFLNWAINLKNRGHNLDHDKEKTIKDMMYGKEKVFPPLNAFGVAFENCGNTSRFLVTLRHGNTGIETVIKHFGIGRSLLKNVTCGLIPYTHIPLAMSTLMREIRKHYYTEEIRTQEFIREFLMRLKSVYDLKRINCISSEEGLLKDLGFVIPRVIKMINDLGWKLGLF